MEKRMQIDNKGMSMVEIILVIAIIGILAGSSVPILGQIRYANTKKAVQTVDSELDKLQVKAMSKAATPYLYIYAYNNSYYMRTWTGKLDSYDSSVLNDDGTKIAGSGITLYMCDDSGTRTKLEGDLFIRIAYTKASVFSDETNIAAVVFSGSSEYTLQLYKDTGKHFVES